MGDKVIDFIRKQSAATPSVRRVWLYGSRAKGTHKENSDYDVAIDWDSASTASWGAFASELLEKKPSLHQLDLVRLDQVGEELKTKIQQEGIVIHG